MTAFPISNTFALRGSLLRDAWLKRSVVCSINVANLSTSTYTALEDSFR